MLLIFYAFLIHQLEFSFVYSFIQILVYFPNHQIKFLLGNVSQSELFEDSFEIYRVKPSFFVLSKFSSSSKDIKYFIEVLLFDFGDFYFHEFFICGFFLKIKHLNLIKFILVGHYLNYNFDEYFKEKFIKRIFLRTKCLEVGLMDQVKRFLFQIVFGRRLSFDGFLYYD